MVRARFRGQSTRLMLTTATGLRPHARAGRVEVFTAMTVLRELARRIRGVEAVATAHEQAIRTLVRSWRPDLLDLPGVGPIIAATVLAAWSHPGRYYQPTRDYAQRRRAQGKTDREIRCCLKRYIARQLYRELGHPPARA